MLYALLQAVNVRCTTRKHDEQVQVEIRNEFKRNHGLIMRNLILRSRYIVLEFKYLN